MTHKRTKLPLNIASGHIVRYLGSGEIKNYLVDWLHAYGADRQGVNTKSYLWHVFSWDRYPALAGNAAKAEYASHVAPEYIVLSNERDQGVETDLRPEEISWADCLVFPPNLAWTMAFTHEDGWYGPYFAKHKHYAALQSENEKKLEKARQAAVAKAKSWW